MRDLDEIRVPGAPQAGRTEGERRELDVPRFAQPDDVTCGPTCLMQVYRFYGDELPYEDIVSDTPRNPDGGTQAVWLGSSALRHGYRATLYPFDLRVFDPSWFDLPQKALEVKLAQRQEAAPKARLRLTLSAWREYLAAGGRVEFAELTAALLTDILDRGHPILCGLSATWLYRQVRERRHDNEWDDIHGEPAGHFVVICGYTGNGRRFMIRDPASHVPFSRNGRYLVPAQRLINAILLGDATSDAVLLELWPRRVRREAGLADVA
jgi:hypothetical protein